MEISKSKNHKGGWRYSFKGIIDVISKVELPVINGKPQVGMLNPHKATIEFNRPAQKSQGVLEANVSAVSGTFSAFEVADFEVEDYSVESFVKSAADHLFIDLNKF